MKAMTLFSLAALCIGSGLLGAAITLQGCDDSIAQPSIEPRTLDFVFVSDRPARLLIEEWRGNELFDGETGSFAFRDLPIRDEARQVYWTAYTESDPRLSWGGKVDLMPEGKTSLRVYCVRNEGE